MPFSNLASGPSAIVVMLWLLAQASLRSTPGVSAFVVTRSLAVQQQQQQTVASRLFATAEAEPKTNEPKVKELPVKYNMDEIVSLCKRRGIIFPSSEIYNGYAGFYDYGPLGSELKKNVKDAWWKNFVTQREDVVGLDSSIIHNPTTWKSSGRYRVESLFGLVRFVVVYIASSQSKTFHVLHRTRGWLFRSNGGL